MFKYLILTKTLSQCKDLTENFDQRKIDRLHSLSTLSKDK